jgi:hypothetical protein
MHLRTYRETSSEVPIHASAEVLTLALQALLDTLIQLFLNYKSSAGRGEPGTWFAGQIGKSKQITDWSKDILVSGRSKGERDTLSHIEFLLIWGCLAKRRNLC